MGRVRFTPEQIIGKLREAELFLGQIIGFYFFRGVWNSRSAR